MSVESQSRQVASPQCPDHMPRLFYLHCPSLDLRLREISAKAPGFPFHPRFQPRNTSQTLPFVTLSMQISLSCIEKSLSILESEQRSAAQRNATQIQQLPEGGDTQLVAELSGPSARYIATCLKVCRSVRPSYAMSTCLYHTKLVKTG
jgi:hypothetical protein